MTSDHSKSRRILLLGGTSEASDLARRFAQQSRFFATLSLAGRTSNPKPAPIAVRSGGFGGAAGLSNYIKTERIDLVIDATHPFAAQISANAIAACADAACALIAVERLPWRVEPGDIWTTYANVEDAVRGLPTQACTVFSGLGRLSLDALELAPQHHYVIRLIDPPLTPLRLPQATLVMARGPFATDDDIALFGKHRVAAVIAKNSGGTAAYSKIAAARALKIPVMMIAPPIIAERRSFAAVDDLWQYLTGHSAPAYERGV